MPTLKFADSAWVDLSDIVDNTVEQRKRLFTLVSLKPWAQPLQKRRRLVKPVKIYRMGCEHLGTKAMCCITWKRRTALRLFE